jgi:hypothetical protein
MSAGWPGKLKFTLILTAAVREFREAGGHLEFTRGGRVDTGNLCEMESAPDGRQFKPLKTLKDLKQYTDLKQEKGHSPCSELPE